MDVTPTSLIIKQRQRASLLPVLGQAPEEVGFFDPQLEVKDKEDAGDVVNFGSKTYFRNVHLFIDAFKDVARTKARGVVRKNLNKCLRGIAQEWYIGELTAVEREWIKEGHFVERWEERLYQRFKKTQSSAFKSLEEESYSISDARNNRETSGFITSVIRHAKDAGITTISAQLT